MRYERLVDFGARKYACSVYESCGKYFNSVYKEIKFFNMLLHIVRGNVDDQFFVRFLWEVNVIHEVEVFVDKIVDFFFFKFSEIIFEFI